MHKDFKKWNKEKQKIHKSETNLFYHSREVWWCALGANIGFEQDGTGKQFDRPVLVLKGFSQKTCIVVSLTGSQKKGKYYFLLGNVGGVEATAVLSQVRLIDTKRFIRKIGTVDVTVFKELQQALKHVLFD